MLDNILETVRRGVERARARGEEVAQVTRLRFEIYQLNRELDGLYGRLGRAYHAGSDPSVLRSIQDEIHRVDEEIAAREQLVTELNTHHGTAEEHAHGASAAANHAGPTVTRAEHPTTPATGMAAVPGVASVPVDTPDTNSSLTDRAATAPRTVSVTATVIPGGAPNMSDERNVTDANGLTSTQQEHPLIAQAAERDPSRDEPNQDYQQRVDEGQGVSQGDRTDADLHGSSAPIPPLGTLAGNAQGIDRAPVTPTVDTEERHEKNLRNQEWNEARKASDDPDPLNK